VQVVLVVQANQILDKMVPIQFFHLSHQLLAVAVVLV
jgi:hypothetical protein